MLRDFSFECLCLDTQKLQKLNEFKSLVLSRKETIFCPFLLSCQKSFSNPEPIIPNFVSPVFQCSVIRLSICNKWKKCFFTIAKLSSNFRTKMHSRVEQSFIGLTPISVPNSDQQHTKQNFWKIQFLSQLNILALPTHYIASQRIVVPHFFYPHTIWYQDPFYCKYQTAYNDDRLYLNKITYACRSFLLHFFSDLVGTTLKSLIVIFMYVWTIFVVSNNDCERGMK